MSLQQLPNGMTIDALRKLFIDGTTPPEIEQILLQSTSICRALLGWPVLEEVRRIIVSGKPSRLTSKLLYEMTVLEATSSLSSDRTIQTPILKSSGTSDSVAVPKRIQATPALPSQDPGTAFLGKRTFTAKRTNRPERFLSQTSTDTKPLVQESAEAPLQAAATHVWRAGPSPEPARIVSDIAEPALIYSYSGASLHSPCIPGLSSTLSKSSDMTVQPSTASVAMRSSASGKVVAGPRYSVIN
ncbi:hypothetical protein GGS23DRAFT_315520 [Durotheca rogersii]|uniref:uncharacterized protein n=1 Tax=Durotheca rogersii TaxID=419775 RepID=UPI00221E9471|nr:uncharacterized protein GGS23DRAFT_315520 [Durotheca rogersii]KAI5859620.1 hypothetical protein GGS23DRAFT_315520 [Durotheca rogersii]